MRTSMCVCVCVYVFVCVWRSEGPAGDYDTGLGGIEQVCVWECLWEYVSLYV